MRPTRHRANNDVDRGFRIRQLRTSRNLSLPLAANGLGIAPAYLSLLERGEGRPSAELLFRMSDYFMVSVHMIERGCEFTYWSSHRTAAQRLTCLQPEATA